MSQCLSIINIIRTHGRGASRWPSETEDEPVNENVNENVRQRSESPWNLDLGLVVVPLITSQLYGPRGLYVCSEASLDST
jgi:hypothetical protein